MVGKITDEDMLAASASGNASTLNFAAFKSISNHLQHQQQQHQPHQSSNSQTYSNKNNNNSSIMANFKRQDSNPK